MALANDQRSQRDALYAGMAPGRHAQQPFAYAQRRPAVAAMAKSAGGDPHLRLFPDGLETKPRKSSEGRIFVAIEGQGSAMIVGEAIRLGLRDTLCVPSWKEARFIAERPHALCLIRQGLSGKAQPLPRMERLT